MENREKNFLEYTGRGRWKERNQPLDQERRKLDNIWRSQRNSSHRMTQNVQKEE